MPRCDAKLKILLYKPGYDTAFMKYENPCEVIIPQGSDLVQIVNSTDIDSNIRNPIIAEYRLVKKHAPVWTDDTKMQQEVMVKLDVEELE